MPIQPQGDLSTSKLLRHAQRAAKTYDSVSVLQQEVGLRMLQRLTWFKFQPNTILNLGCRTGNFSKLLKNYYPKAAHFNVDLSFNMLKLAKNKSGWFNKPNLICATAETLPLAAQSLDLIFCNLILTQSAHVPKILVETKRILKPGGLIMFTSNR